MYITYRKFIQSIKNRIKDSDVHSSTGRVQPFDKRAGFSMIELLVALSLSVMTATGLTLTMTQGVKNIRAIQRANRLNANAEFVASTLTYWVKQSAQISSPAASTLDLTLGDFSHKTIALTGTNITLDGSAITGNDIEINNLAFTALKKSVRISYTLKAKNAKETLSVTTTVAQRSP